MFGMSMGLSMRLMGPVEWLTNELQSATTPGRQASLLWKLALSHSPRVIPTIVPYLGATDRRVRSAAVRGIAHFGEDARAPMLEILADPNRRALHAGAVRVLARVVAACQPA